MLLVSCCQGTSRARTVEGPVFGSHLLLKQDDCWLLAGRRLGNARWQGHVVRRGQGLLLLQLSALLLQLGGI